MLAVFCFRSNLIYILLLSARGSREVLLLPRCQGARIWDLGGCLPATI